MRRAARGGAGARVHTLGNGGIFGGGGVHGTGTARRCKEFPSGMSSAGVREAAAACGGERRRTDVGAGWWEMGRAVMGAMPWRGSPSGLADTEKKPPWGQEA
jgi:hypothetical protein